MNPVRLAARAAPVCALLLALTVHAQERRELPPLRTYGEPATAADAAAIKALVGEYRNAWAGQDTARLMSLHSADTEWINAYARMFQGAAPLSDFIENRLFPAFDAAVSAQEASNMETVSLRWLPGAVVIHMFTEGARGPSRNADEQLRRTHLHLVLEKRRQDWKIVHTAIMDAR